VSGLVGETQDFIGATAYSIHETPFYVLEREKLLSNLAEFRRALAGIDIYYAVKANPEEAVIRTLATAGAGFEAASLYEVQLLQKVGVAPDRVIFGTAVKPSGHIREVFDWGVTRCAADSLAELEKIAAAAPGARVHLRVAVDDSQSVFPLGEKFGCRIADLPELAIQAIRLGLDPYGLSFHVGSQASSVSAWSDAIYSLVPVIGQLHRLDVPITTLNLGGGFPCRYDDSTQIPDIAAIGDAIGKAAIELPEQIQLMAEPGRYLVASAASLVVSVIGRSSRAGNEWLFLDAGCYNGLFEAMAYQGRTRYRVRPAGTTTQTTEQSFNLAGPTGDVADVIARDVPLPADISLGDRLLFENVGAYTMSMSVPFNGFPRPDLLVE
jgi:ornithine decarboxylase